MDEVKENPSTQQTSDEDNLFALVQKLPFSTLFPSTTHKQRKFLAAYLATGVVDQAGRLMGMDDRMHYYWLNTYPNYKAAFEKAKEILADRAEDELYRRGITGYEEPLSYQGRLTGDKIRKYSDALTMFFLKGARPDKYRDSVSPYASGPVAVQIVFAPSPLPQDSKLIANADEMDSKIK